MTTQLQLINIIIIIVIVIIIIIIIMFRSWFQTFAVFWMLYAFFWVIPRRLNFTCRRFGTLCSIFISGVRRKKDKNLSVDSLWPGWGSNPAFTSYKSTFLLLTPPMKIRHSYLPTIECTRWILYISKILCTPAYANVFLGAFHLTRI